MHGAPGGTLCCFNNDVPGSVVFDLVHADEDLVVNEKLTNEAIVSSVHETDDVLKLPARATTNNSLTIGLNRPTAPFDYYIVETSEEGRSGQETSLSQPEGSCRNGKVFDRSMTRATCGYLDACTNIHYTVRAISDARNFTVTSIRVLFVPSQVPHGPDVTNLKLAVVGKDFFKVTWEMPTASFDAYWTEIVDLTGGNITEDLNRYGTCAGYMQIQPNQTELTCSGLEPCSNFSVTIGTLTHPPLLTFSSGATLTGILISETVSPVVRNLTVSSSEDEKFTLTWQKPEGCFEYYEVQVIDNGKGSSGDRSHGIVSCNNGTVIDSSQTSVTCDQPDACTNVIISVRPNVSGGPGSTQNGDTLVGIHLPGK
ncbi:hypothetical protein MTO96_045557, partial [Rhipicephalus appendiculatus]